MFAKRLFHKVTDPKSPKGGVQSSIDLHPRVTLHYGIPATSSILAFDPIQSLLAVGTLDGRIKVIGGDNIEALLVSPKQLPFKYLQFLQNQGILVSISNDNDIQVWDLKLRDIVCTMQWDSNVTAFSVIRGTTYMYIGDENGVVFVLKYDADKREIIQLPYLIPAESIAESAAISVPPNKSVVGVLPQPMSNGIRLLIAYEHGLIVLWDVSQNQAMFVRSCKDDQSKDQAVVVLSKEGKSDSVGNASEDEQLEKEISSVCWASSDGSTVAIGYVDGDIMLWNLSSYSSTKNQRAVKPGNDSVKLQLSLGDRRLPVIILHWSVIKNGGPGGQLFVYGGTEIGSEEVLTILNLDWSRGMQNVKCVGRTDITLNGSFADMVLVPPSDEMEGVHSSAPLILTNPGQLHFYEGEYFSALSHQERRDVVSPMPYEMAIPTVEPEMTASKLISVPKDEKFVEFLSELAQASKLGMTDDLSNEDKRWPIYGGVPRPPLMEDYNIERVYLAGYQDGTVRLWDATYPDLSRIYVLEPEVKGAEICEAHAAVSAFDFCSVNLHLAVGNECGLVCLYKLSSVSDPKGLHVLSTTNTEVCEVPQQDGPQCVALFSLLKSPVRALGFANSGSRLIVGFESSQVLVIDTAALSVLNLTDAISSSPVVSLTMSSFLDSKGNNHGESQSNIPCTSEKSVTFVLTKDVSTAVLDNEKGNLIASRTFHFEKESIAISLNIIGENHASPSERTEDEPAGLISNFCALLCCEDSITLYSFKSPIEIDEDFIRKVDLAEPCSWSMILRKDERDYALVLLYQSGMLEIRSLPKLEVIVQSSLTSLLRWSFKTNMEKTLSFSDNGQISLVNGSEFSFISLLASENNFRIPQFLPCLHDEVLAAAADASIDSSLDGKKSQGSTARGFLETVLRSLEGKEDNDPGLLKVDCTNPAQLDSIFSKPLSLESPADVTPNQGVIELNIDDIDIDGPLIVSSPYQKPKVDDKNTKQEKERLFEGSSSNEKPRMRTREEIVAKYRKTPAAGDAHAAAAQARDKLAERGEKLEKMRERTEELQNGAEDFASMAAELAKRMENRKWWNF